MTHVYVQPGTYYARRTWLDNDRDPNCRKNFDRDPADRFPVYFKLVVV